MSQKRKRCRYILCGLLFFVVWTIWGNVTIKTTVLEIYDENLPKGLIGYQIAQVSDLHNAEFGKDNAKILRILQKQKPDFIALTGDLVDSSHTNIDVAVSFAEQAVKIAPCYYVTGNHEAWLQEEYQNLEQRLTDCGVHVMRNQAEQITVNGDIIQLIGVDDPDFTGGMPHEIIAEEIENAGVREGYKILLCHRPEVFSVYVEKDINLAFCGHAHGGQFRIPFVGGLVAPNQGFFPKYDGGIYKEGDTTMIVSRGIGNSIIPVRFNNRPEVVITMLQN